MTPGLRGFERVSRTSLVQYPTSSSSSSRSMATQSFPLFPRDENISLVIVLLRIEAPRYNTVERDIESRVKGSLNALTSAEVTRHTSDNPAKIFFSFGQGAMRAGKIVAAARLLRACNFGRVAARHYLGDFINMY